MPYNNEKVLAVAINKATQASESIIAAPDSGKRIAIDLLVLSAVDGNNQIELIGNIDTAISILDNTTVVIANSLQAPQGIFPMNDAQAFTIALGTATTVRGYVLYRIVG